MSLSDEKYVSVTTFRKSGDAVSTPTWIVPLEDGRVGFWTSSEAGKAKRLRNNPRVTLQPCDSRGKLKPGSAASEGVAELITSGTDFDAVNVKVRAKYGVMVQISRFFNTVGHLGKPRQPYGDVAVIIDLSS